MTRKGGQRAALRGALLVVALLDVFFGAPVCAPFGEGGSRAEAAGKAAAEERAADLASKDVDKVLDALTGARSYKVRVQAAAVLAKLRDPRVIGALARTLLSDAHPTVRAFVARQLGRVASGDDEKRARVALERAKGDRSASVRAAVAQALTALDGRGARTPALELPALSTTSRLPPPAGHRLTVAVGAVGDRSGHASARTKEKLRLVLAQALAREPNVTLAGANAAGLSYIVDGVFKKLDFAPRGQDLEQVCAIELVVSRPPRGIQLVASGEAIVQRPRLRARPQIKDQMEDEAIEHAARSAHDSLAQFFKSH